MARTYCPNCDAAVNVQNPVVGNKVTCKDCETGLEIANTDPFVVDFPADYYDDWDDEDDDDEDE